MNLLGRHLKGLFDFSGRENRQPFWLWILIVYIVQLVVMMIAMIPLMISWVDQMTPAMQGDRHKLDNDPQAVFQMMMPMMQNMMMVILAITVLFLVLTVAAVVRRLHDSDRSGWWASPYYAMQIVSPIVMAWIFPRYFTIMTSMASAKPGSPPDMTSPAFQQAMQSMSLMSLVNLLSFAILVMMIVFLVLPGTVGSNRYGDDPLQPSLDRA
jgi:uncharacterized membrane protein YhaH (DUF805 family)